MLSRLEKVVIDELLRHTVCFFKQKTAYEMRISDWSSDVCSSDLLPAAGRSTMSRSSFAFDPLRERSGFARSSAPKEQPPRKLSGKRTARERRFWKAAAPGMFQPDVSHRRSKSSGHLSAGR